MERDCMIAHGAASFLKERLFTVSDQFSVSVCKKCGIIATGKKCQKCRGDSISVCNVPYASKLFFTELQSLGIKLGIKPSED